jgi:multicomponent Na+:H+ antiporter subunit G
VREAIVIALAAVGLAFTLSGAVGILRMPDVYSRIQCSSKTVTMGALPVLIALVVAEGPVSSYGSRALLVAVLLLILNPASSHALARAAYKSGVPMWPGAVTDEPREQARSAAGDRPAGSETARDGGTAGDGEAAGDGRADGPAAP